MMKAHLRTEYKKGLSHRVLNIWQNTREIISLHGDPAKAIAILMIFKEDSVGPWGNNGLDVEVPADVYEALQLLSKCKTLTWKKAFEWGLIPDPTPEKVKHFACIIGLLK